jgi:O-6-methylguanine DNA methyltransferase
MTTALPDNADVITSLGMLAKTAPDDLVPAVLVAAGLAHRYARLPGPTGELVVTWGAQGVSAVAPVTDAATFGDAFEDRPGRRFFAADALPERLEGLVRQVVDTGKLGNLPVDLSGLTPFQQSVLRVTATIPPGELRPYGWIAREVGRPGASRAVGSALNRNPVPVLMPCHRVGRSDGTIGEYTFGSEMKRDLLRYEGLDPDVIDADAGRGVRLIGSDTTHIFCLPTCRNAKRITEAHRVELGSEKKATGLGFRACKVCRPAA